MPSRSFNEPAPRRASRQAVGRLGESIAAGYLERAGLTILERNRRVGRGELDILAREGSVLVVVEVRTRRGPRMGSPEESIGWRKSAQLMRLGMLTVQSIGWSGPWRIDVVAVELAGAGRTERITHYRNAVGPG